MRPRVEEAALLSSQPPWGTLSESKKPNPVTGLTCRGPEVPGGRAQVTEVAGAEAGGVAGWVDGHTGQGRQDDVYSIQGIAVTP